MRKVLSFVLVLAMILGSVSMAFAATSTIEPFEDAKDSLVATALKDLGVLYGDENGKVNLDTPITRAEFCAILTRVLGNESYAKSFQSGVSSFSDVKAGYWANGYIILANMLGYVDGVGNGKFNPQGNVSYEMGVAFIMKALGYSQEYVSAIYKEFSWPYNYLYPAQKLRIIDGTIEIGTVLTRAQLFDMLYVALEEQTITYSPSYSYNAKGELSVSIGNVSTVGVLKTKAENYTGATYSTGYAVVKNENSFANTTYGATLVDEYKGKVVEAILQKFGSEYKILGILDVASNQLTGTFVATGSPFTAITFAGITVTSCAFDPHGTYYFNGTSAACGEFDAVMITAISNAAATLDAEVVYAEDGTIKKFTSVNNLWLANDWKCVKTTAEATALQTGFASQYALFFGEKAVYTSNASVQQYDVVVEGDATKLEDIKQYDCLTYYVDANGKIEKVVVSRNNVTAAYEGTYNKNDVDYFTYGGKTYTVSTYGTKPSDTIGSTYAVYLDENDRIIATENTEKVAETKPSVVTGYALFTKISSTSTNGIVALEITRTAVNNSVELYDLASGEKLAFDNLTTGGTSWDSSKAFGIMNSTWADGITGVEEEVVYEYGLKNDKLVTIAAAAEKATQTDLKISAKGVASGTDFYPYAETVSVVSVSGLKVVAKDLAWLKNYTTADAVLTVKNGFVTEVVAVNVTAPAVEEITTYDITKAAVEYTGTDAKGNYVVLFAGSDTAKAGKYYTDAALNQGDIILNVEYDSKNVITAYETLEGTGLDKLTTTAGYTFTAANGYTTIYEDGSEQVVCYSPVVWKLDSETKTFSVLNVSVKEAVAAAKVDASFYDTDYDGYADFIIVK